MLLDHILVSLLAVSLILWVGGAVTGQIWMFRARTLGDMTFTATLVPYINWIIRRIYVPAAATAFSSGMILAWRSGVPFTTPWLLFLIVVFLATIAVGSSYSLPEYARLAAQAQDNSQDPALHRRIATAAWVNRVELLLVLTGLVGVINQVMLG